MKLADFPLLTDENIDADDSLVGLSQASVALYSLTASAKHAATGFNDAIRFHSQCPALAGAGCGSGLGMLPPKRLAKLCQAWTSSSLPMAPAASHSASVWWPPLTSRGRVSSVARPDQPVA